MQLCTILRQFLEYALNDLEEEKSCNRSHWLVLSTYEKLVQSRFQVSMEEALETFQRFQVLRQESARENIMPVLHRFSRKFHSDHERHKRDICAEYNRFLLEHAKAIRDAALEAEGTEHRLIELRHRWNELIERCVTSESSPWFRRLHNSWQELVTEPAEDNTRRMFLPALRRCLPGHLSADDDTAAPADVEELFKEQVPLLSVFEGLGHGLSSEMTLYGRRFSLRKRDLNARRECKG